MGGKAVGHCTSHTLTFNRDTKEHAVKPLAVAAKSAGLWKGKSVSALSISISFEGLRFYDETENGHEQIAPLWGKGQTVEVEAFKRGSDSAPYLKGNFVIASLEETSPAQDDATYNGSLENDGEPEIYSDKTTTGSGGSTGKQTIGLMKRIEVTINGKAYPCRQTMGAMLRFKQEAGIRRPLAYTSSRITPQILSQQGTERMG